MWLAVSDVWPRPSSGRRCELRVPLKSTCQKLQVDPAIVWIECTAVNCIIECTASQQALQLTKQLGGVSDLNACVTLLYKDRF